MARDPFSDVDVANLLDPKGRLRVTRVTYASLAREVGNHRSRTTQIVMLLRSIVIPLTLVGAGITALIFGFMTKLSLWLAVLWAIPLLIIGFWMIRSIIHDVADLLRLATRVLEPHRRADGTFDPFNPPPPRREARGGVWEPHQYHQNLGPDGGRRFRRGIALPPDATSEECK